MEPTVEEQVPPQQRLKYMVINNVSKHKNVIQILESASVYGYQPVMCQMGKMRRLIPEPLLENLISFETLTEMKEYMAERNVKLVGIEITDQSIALPEYKFPQNIALMPGNEGLGLSEKQIEVCDEFVYIPHYGNGTASLNVHIATGVILHHDFIYHEKLAQQSLQQPQSSPAQATV